MAKWFGAVGYAIPRETKSGVFRDVVEERKYYGTLLRNKKQSESGEGLNDNINISNEISIVADAFACQNFHFIRYIEFMGAKWKVRSVDVQPPRLIFSIGGVYNEQQTGTP